MKSNKWFLYALLGSCLCLSLAGHGMMTGASVSLSCPNGMAATPLSSVSSSASGQTSQGTQTPQSSPLLPWTCTPCPAGQFRDSSVQPRMSNVTALLGQAVQQQINQGVFNGLDNSTTSISYSACGLCPSGSSTQGLETSTKCTVCGPGTFSDTPGSSTCVDCPAGYASDVSNATKCDPCPPGWKSNQRSLSCTPCSMTEYQPNRASAACLSCEQGTETGFRGATASSDCLCAVGKYLDSNDGSCQDCPSGAVCEGGLIPPYPASGYWALNGSLSFFECTWSPMACIGGPDHSCRKGHSGRLCAKCLGGQFWKLGSLCFECDRISQVYSILVISVVSVLSIGIVVLTAAGASASMNSFLQYLQIAAVLPKLAGRWPAPVENVLSTLSVLLLNVEVLQLSCSVSHAPEDTSIQYTEFLIKSLIPVGLVGGTGIAAGMMYLCTYYQRKRYMSPEALGFDKKKTKNLSPQQVKALERANKKCWQYLRCHQMATACLSAASFLYLPATLQVLEYMFCTTSNGVSYVLLEPITLCNTPEWRSDYLPYVVVALVIFTVATPLAFMAMLYVCRQHLNHPDMVKSFALFWSKYNSQYFWWETIFFLRKILVAFIVIFLRTRPNYQATCLIVVMFGFMLGHFYVHPYSFWALNRLDDALFGFTLTVYFLGVLFRGNSDGSDPEPIFEELFIVVSFIVEAFSVLVGVLAFFMEIKQMLRVRNLNFFSEILSKQAKSATGDPRDLMRFSKLLAHQNQLPQTSIRWLVHAAKVKDKAELTLVYRDLAPVLIHRKERLLKMASFNEMSIVGNSVSKIVRWFVEVASPGDRRTMQHFMESLVKNKFKPYFFDSTDPTKIADWIIANEDRDLEEAFIMLMGSLQSWHLRENFERRLKRVDLFKNTKSEFISSLVMKLRPRIAQSKEIIVKKGDLGDAMYFVNRGECEVVVTTPAGNELVVHTMYSGDFFGEIALLIDTPRTATVRAKGHADLYVLTRQNMQEVMDRFPEVRKSIEAEALRRKLQLEAPKDKEEKAKPTSGANSRRQSLVNMVHTIKRGTATMLRSRERSSTTSQVSVDSNGVRTRRGSMWQSVQKTMTRLRSNTKSKNAGSLQQNEPSTKTEEEQIGARKGSTASAVDVTPTVNVSSRRGSASSVPSASGDAESDHGIDQQDATANAVANRNSTDRSPVLSAAAFRPEKPRIGTPLESRNSSGIKALAKLAAKSRSGAPAQLHQASGQMSSSQVHVMENHQQDSGFVVQKSAPNSSFAFQRSNRKDSSQIHSRHENVQLSVTDTDLSGAASVVGSIYRADEHMKSLQQHITSHENARARRDRRKRRKAERALKSRNRTEAGSHQGLLGGRQYRTLSSMARRLNAEDFESNGVIDQETGNRGGKRVNSGQRRHARSLQANEGQGNTEFRPRQRALNIGSGPNKPVTDLDLRDAAVSFRRGAVDIGQSASGEVSSSQGHAAILDRRRAVPDIAQA